MKIAEKYLKQETRQEYAAKEKIAGVEIIVSNWFSTTDGNFAEILRYDEGKINGAEGEVVIRQLNWSYVMPGSVKAYHYHQNQQDIWFVPPYDRLLVNLHDLREDSPTFERHQTLVLGAGKNMIIVIPKGVAHGCANPYEKPATLFYMVDQQFDPANPDEKRLAWDLWGQQVWEIEKG